MILSLFNSKGVANPINNHEMLKGTSSTLLSTALAEVCSVTCEVTSTSDVVVTVFPSESVVVIVVSDVSTVSVVYVKSSSTASFASLYLSIE